MSKILAFAGSNSSTSINYKLVKYTATLLENANEVTLMDMAEFQLPLFSEDIEREEGHPKILKDFAEKIVASDAILLSVNEHNGSMSSFFKNLLDWLSRLNLKFLANKKVLLMSTSPGKRGAIGAHNQVNDVLPRFGAEIVSTFSLPSFYDNLDKDNGIIDAQLKEEHQNAIHQFLAKI